VVQSYLFKIYINMHDGRIPDLGEKNGKPCTKQRRTKGKITSTLTISGNATRGSQANEELEPHSGTGGCMDRNPRFLPASPGALRL
jgi:hypothetical protein